MLILALDTATPVTTVAVHDGACVLASVARPGATSHGELLAPAIEQALQEADVDGRDVTDVAVGVGPGPFTGLRVGVVTARTLGVSWGARVHGVCTLDVLASQVAAAVPVDGPFVVATDARRREVYWAEYAPDGARIAGPDVARPADLAGRFSAATRFVGRGAQLYADVLDPIDGPEDPDAAALAALVASGAAVEVGLEPLYLRRPDATPPGERKRAS
ncbi:tRNA threonylcarbamoyl adenosine modification protein YeaZ [Mumia flava]|uniref:tRNA threonylcarbamoyl adenosine modification protein YeaZ n=1 Tax=Mumia flava TaxID=1348852 RepID=A0A0B2BNK5_9ACTN|nr:tRNA (adenosine(37)-N6)-threonylcarbamoyltransferase complex dimerization subunit type 1 TsaB [Mumia flava]PJJ58394.1 tRNA threonylcarbamoyl adenosine modification protein YeaZ [Mumia flava]